MIARAVHWGLPPLLVAAALASLPGSAEAEATLTDVRDATVRFHSLTQAAKAGYADNPLPCFDDPSGGMGEHLINGDLLLDGGTLDPLAPEALVYEVRDNGGWKLVGVEYVVLFSDVPSTATAPTVLGQPLTPNFDLGLWKLHAWLFEDNLLGVFQDWNPEVPDCPTD